MNKGVVVSVALLALSAFASTGVAEDKKGATGEDLFKLHCAACHPDGGNIINPKETLSKADREKHGVKNAKDIVGKMRKPGPGMTTFDTKALPDKDAQAIAGYILKTFK
jgi:cytochrome c6